MLKRVGTNGALKDASKNMVSAESIFFNVDAINEVPKVCMYQMYESSLNIKVN